MKRLPIAVAALLLVGVHGPALAQAKAKPAPAPVELTKEQMDHAVQDFGIMSSALRSDKVPEEVKSALMSCIYSVSLGEITGHIDKLIAANAGKIDRKSPDDVLSAMAAVCGYKAPAEPAATPPAGKAPQGGVTGR
jgi:hypothetical protein